MVKKRNRDPEVLPEAPLNTVNDDNDSGSDEVGFPPRLLRVVIDLRLGCGHDKCGF
jgi:hypothetical protein